MCLLVTLAVSGCRDAASDPFAVVLPDGDMAGFLGQGGLPSLGSLAAEAELEPDLGPSLEAWWGSWDRPAPEGREVRHEAYRQAAAPLADALGRPSVERVLAHVEDALAAADGLDPQALGNRILEQLELARDARDAARRSLAGDRVDDALLQALIASDLLREIGPESVIRVMIREAEGRLRVLKAEGGAEPRAVSPDDLERGERLVRGARLSLESGDWARAAQRAFYACQLLGLQPN